MKEEQAYELLQKLLDLAEELKASGHYSVEEIKNEITNRCGE